MMGLWWWWVLASRRLSAMVFNEVSLRFRVVFMEEKREGGAHAMHKLSLFFFFPTTFHCFLLVESDWYVFRIKSPKNIFFFFFFFLAKQAVPIDLKPTHCFWAQILILSSACASCNTFEHEFWAKCKISNFKIEYLWRYLKYHSYLICTLKWSDQYCN